MRRISLPHLQPLIYLIAAFTFLIITTPAQAQAPTPQTPETVVHPLQDPQAAAPIPLSAPAGGISLPPMKAVLLVGPIDGDTGSWTKTEIANMELAANVLEKNGVQVHRFYTPNNNWEKIKAAANGAHFLLYRGHGVYWGSMPTPPVGGFSLKDGIVSSETIRRDLRLAANAIVMIYGCFSAGSAANDTGSISESEARRRVAQYASPFVELGAGGYYADWFGDAFQNYLQSLFAGRTLRQAYEGYHDYNPNAIWRGAYPGRSDVAMWLGWDTWQSTPPPPQYNNAFVGKPDATLQTLFSNTKIVIQPSEIHLMADPREGVRSYTFQVHSSTGERFQWTASLAAGAPASVTLAPSAQGLSGDSFMVIVDPSRGSGDAVVRVQATSPVMQNNTHEVTIHLKVVEGMEKTFLPILTH